LLNNRINELFNKKSFQKNNVCGEYVRITKFEMGGVGVSE